MSVTPASPASASTRAPLERHRPLDCSVVCLEAEVIPFGASGFNDSLHSDMRCQPLGVLARRYPELTFTRLESRLKPSGYDIVEPMRGGNRWTAASWRTT